MTELNILILGQTGVGKSTFINALATYITYDSLEEAVSKDLVALIPTEFHQIDSNMRELTIQTGESMNECFVKGKSATKSPRAYVLEHNGCRYRIIDTPGIGDVDGIAVDKQNMQNIMHFAAQYDKIHAICVLLLPNVSRLTEEFQLYFNELFVQFHRSAANNIIFCYTNTSGYMFKPQQTLTQLDLLLKKINTQHRIEIKARDKNRAYSFDNMAYRYCCIKNQYPHFEFSEDEESVYTKSYAISRQESDRMLKFIRTLTPHDSKESMSIFYVRHMIECCTYPLAAIGNAIQKTIAQIDEYKEHVRRFGDNVNELKKMLMTKEEDIAVASRIRNIEENKDKLNKNIRSNEVLKNEIESEQKQIYEACVKGAFFLQTNALTPINDATEGYLTKLIESGKQCGTREKVREYEKMLDNYLKEKNIFYHHISRLPKGVQHIRSDEMLKLLNSLKKMKHYGKDVEAAMNQALKPARIDSKGDEQREVEYKRYAEERAPEHKRLEQQLKKQLEELEKQFKGRAAEHKQLQEQFQKREGEFKKQHEQFRENIKKENREQQEKIKQQYENDRRQFEDQIKKGEEKHKKELQQLEEQFKERENKLEEERKQREKKFRQLEKTVQEDRKKEQEEREARFQKLLEAQSKEKQDELKKEHAEECKRREQQYAKERKRREYEFEQREQQHKQEYEKEHKRLKQEHEEELKRHEQHEQQLKEEVDKYKSADFEKWTILKKDDSINSLLKKIEDKYPGSEMDKLRAEARDKFGIDSDKFNLGITGQSGVGKSTLVNALRGYDDNDPEAATVGITECTDEVKGYPHPKIEHLVLYDLPGAGTRRHRAETYFCDKRLYVFDCLLVVMAVRAFEDDLILAKFAQEKGTPVIFIRNKAKNDFETMQDKNKDMKEEELIELTISTIKKSTKEEIEKVGIKNPNIFIIEGRSLRECKNMKFEELNLLKHLSELQYPRSDLSLEKLVESGKYPDLDIPISFNLQRANACLCEIKINNDNDFFIGLPRGFDQVLQTLRMTPKFNNSHVINDNEATEPYIGKENNQKILFGFVNMEGHRTDQSSEDSNLLELECPEECTLDPRRWICTTCGDYVTVKSNNVGWQFLFCSCGSKKYKEKLLVCHHPSHRSQEPNKKQDEQEILHPPVPDTKETQNQTINHADPLSSICQQLQKFQIKNGKDTDPKIFIAIISLLSNNKSEEEIRNILKDLQDMALDGDTQHLINLYLDKNQKK